MNKFIGIGRLTKNPEVRYTNSSTGEQMAIARFTLAIDRVGKNKETDFINCVAFGRQGEFVEKYLKQGIKIAVTGRIQTGSYTNKEGKKVYTTDIVVEGTEFCEGKKESTESTESTPPSAPDDYMDIPDGITDSLPFK